VIKTIETKDTLVPFYRLYTPYSLRSKAEFSERYSTCTRTALAYTATGTHTYGRLFKLPIIPQGVFTSDTADITVKITVGLDNDIRSSTDSGPKFFLSHGQDGDYGMGFEMRDENIPCRGIEGSMENTLNNRYVHDQPSHSSKPIPEQFTMILNPSERWGSCYHSVDSGVISPTYFSRYRPYLTKGLHLEVYRESTSEQYTFNYIIVEVFENN